MLEKVALGMYSLLQHRDEGHVKLLRQELAEAV